MSNRDVVEFLATVPLLEGVARANLIELADVMRRRALREGDLLWQEGQQGNGMALIVDGQVSVTKRLPNDRTVQLAELGPGEALGEIPLIDGGEYLSTARVTEAASVLSLSRPDFAALVSRRHPSAFALKRRVATAATADLRRRLRNLAVPLGAEAASKPAAEATQTFAELEPCDPPDSRYIRRMATFRTVDPLALWGFLTAGHYARCAKGRTLVAEGAAPAACYLTINGAVENVLIRDGERIRVEIAGPGRAFGYEGLIDGLPAPLTAISRERALLLVLSDESFDRLFGEQTDVSHVFLDVINRNLTASLRQALRRQARLAVSV